LLFNPLKEIQRYSLIIPQKGVSLLISTICINSIFGTE
jgi:hypothetical protein